MNHHQIRNLAVLALASSVVLVSTYFLKIPTPTGYIHLGDGAIYATALAFGPALGGISGALGSSMADLLGGYAAWAPWTLVIKGMAGFLAGKFGHRKSGKLRLVALIGAAVWTIAGYAAGTAVLYSPGAVLAESLGNIFQTGSGVLIGLYLGPVLGNALGKNRE